MIRNRNIVIKTLLCIQLTVLLSFNSYSQENPTIDDLKYKILNNESFEAMTTSIKENDFEITNNKKSVPKCLIRSLNSKKKKKIKFANPDEDYESTDLISDMNKPRRQIMLLAINENAIIITYKHGGIGLHNHLLWCQFKKNEVIDIWIGNTFKDLYTMDEILEYLQEDPKKMHTNMICY